MHTEVDRPVEQASHFAHCPQCGHTMQRVFFAPTMLNRQKPGTVKSFLDREVRRGEGKANALKALRIAEQRGGEHWRKVRSETLTSELKEMQAYRKAHGV